MQELLRDNDLTGGQGDLEIKRGCSLQSGQAAFCGMVGEGRLHVFTPGAGSVLQILCLPTVQPP